MLAYYEMEDIVHVLYATAALFGNLASEIPVPGSVSATSAGSSARVLLQHSTHRISTRQ